MYCHLHCVSKKFVAILQINLHARSAEVLDVGSDTDTPREVSVILHEVVHANEENTTTFSI